MTENVVIKEMTIAEYLAYDTQDTIIKGFAWVPFCYYYLEQYRGGHTTEFYDFNTNDHTIRIVKIKKS